MVRFLWFLLVNGALDKFTYNLTQRGDYSSYRELGIKVERCDWIMQSFLWAETAEGVSYWYQLNNLWRKKNE